MDITRQALDDAVLWTLIRAATRVKRDLGALFAEHDLSPVQFGVLSNLAAEPQITTAELARRVLTRPQSLADVVDGLAERGLLDRPGPRGRGHRTVITLTAAGEEVLASVWPQFLAANDLTTRGVDDLARAELNRLLVRFLQP